MYRVIAAPSAEQLKHRVAVRQQYDNGVTNDFFASDTMYRAVSFEPVSEPPAPAGAETGEAAKKKLEAKRAADRRVNKMLKGSSLPGPITKQFAVVAVAVMALKFVGIWLVALFSAFAKLLVMYHLIGLLVVVYFLLYFVRFYNEDLYFLITDSYALVAALWNYVAGQYNYYYELFRPFIPAYNLYYFFQKLFQQLFWKLIPIPFMISMLHILVQVTFEMMPTIILLAETLIPVLIQLVPPLIDIVNTLFILFLPTFVDLIELAMQFVQAIAPIIPTLVGTLSILVSIAIQQFGQFFPMLVNMAVIVINAAIPFIQDLATDLVGVLTQVSAEITLAGGVGSGSGGLGQFFDFIFLLIKHGLPLIVKVGIALATALLDMVVANLGRIVEFVVVLLKVAINLIIAIVRVLVNIFTGPLFSQVRILALVVIQAVVDVLPSLYTAIQTVLTSGILVSVVQAVLEGFMTPNSPVLFISIANQFGNVLTSSTTVAIEGFIAGVRITVIFIPLVVQILIIVVSSGILNVLFNKLVELFVVAFPLIVNAIITLFNDVFVNVILRILFENLADFLIAVFNTLVQIVIGMPLVVITKLLVVLLKLVLQLMPKILTILTQLLIGSLLIVVQLTAAVLYLVHELFASNDILQILFDMLYAILAGFFRVLFQLDILQLQFFFDIVFRMIHPFFRIILLPFNIDLDSLKMDFESQQQIADALAIFYGTIFEYIEMLFSLIASVLQVSVIFSALQTAYAVVAPYINIIVKGAATVFFTVIKPIVCPIDIVCCTLLIAFECCVFPALCASCCCFADGGCPPASVGCSCFFG